jgi:signal transduction histidine kinase
LDARRRNLAAGIENTGCGSLSAIRVPSTPQPQPFFENKARAFWTLHLIGWVAWVALRATSGFANGMPLSWLVPVLISGITGFSLTLVLSVIFRTLIQRRPLVTWSFSLLGVIVAALINAFTDAWVLDLQRGIDQSVPFSTRLLVPFYLAATTLSAWSALYYAINYFLRVEEQADQLQALEAQATSAQLAMLRYQINPHFLFNTLNSISTLVLLKQTEPANAMLSRLSAFLRYTLINEPAAQVTLEQEMETLRLYLEIEKMRFEDRLRTRFDIDPRAAQTQVPSLILQPLVENAIKYAVTPNEDGADIIVTAHLVGQNVQIIVSDSGPGLHPTCAEATVSTGVGLPNIRERLAQAYGPHHRFDTREAAGGGFTVTLEVPFRPVESTAVEPGAEPKVTQSA